METFWNLSKSQEQEEAEEEEEEEEEQQLTNFKDRETYSRSKSINKYKLVIEIDQHRSGQTNFTNMKASKRIKIENVFELI